MPLRHKKNYLICYDIADGKRLQRLHRYLSQNAISVQYSVFHARWGEKKLNKVKSDIGQMIDDRKDDVRIYHLPAKLNYIAFGKSSFPEGISLVDHDLNLLFNDID